MKDYFWGFASAFLAAEPASVFTGVLEEAAFADVFFAADFAGTGGILNASEISPADSTMVTFVAGSAETIRYVS